jgi:hypothetical protein
MRFRGKRWFGLKRSSPDGAQRNPGTAHPGLGFAPSGLRSIQRLSQFRANPSSPCGMKMTIAMKMIPTGMR